MKKRNVGRRKADAEPSFVFTSGQVKWALGLLAGLAALIIGWQQVWERFETHWRLETIQASQDKRIDADIKAVREKAEADTKALARRAEVGRAWLFYSIGDFRADNSQQWAQVCPALKQPPEVCAKWLADAQQYRQEAADAKRQATEAGKGTP